MQQRVACQGRPGHPCGAHRDVALSARCQVCGSSEVRPVRATMGDCYVMLARWAGELLDISPTPETLTIVEAIRAGSLVADEEAARRRR